MLPVISLISFVGVILVSSMIKKNAGIVAMIVSYLLGVFVVGMSAKEIYKGGWPTSVFFILLGTTFLFGIASVNGTTQVLAKNVIWLAKGNRQLAVFLIFGFGAAISATGAGALIVGVLMPIALTVADEYDIPVLMMSLVTMGGIMAGGASPLAITGIVAKQLSFEQGITDYSTLWLAFAVSMTVFSILAYLFLGGLKLGNTSKSNTALGIVAGNIPKEKSKKSDLTFTKFDNKQLMTIAAVCVVIIGVVFFNQNIALLAFACAAVLILLNAADQKEAIAAIPWSSLLLISGVAILINIVTSAGGIDYLSNQLSSLMGVRSAQPFMVVLGGLLGAVSSGSGVAMPTLIPLAPQLAAQVGGDVTTQKLILGCIIGINGVMISPLSTVGAIAVASAPKSVNTEKLYNQLLLSAIAFIIINAVASLLGFYNIFA